MVQGQSPWWGSEVRPLKLKAFRLFSYKRAKSLVFKLKKTLMFAIVWSMGGRPPGPPIPGSAIGPSYGGP